ncbi:hypothetical protein BGZ92_000406 [Podila epicladia]|nr:hypothetical protein BGZ92_000406 [Podila epicladia]
MDNNPLTLFCLVDGEATSQAFPVEIESTKTIGSLKQCIKTDKTPRFDDVAADELTLWRVSVPITDDNDEIPILLSSVTSNKKKLGPATRLSKVFPEELPEETVHILVQRPPRAPITSALPNNQSLPASPLHFLAISRVSLVLVHHSLLRMLGKRVTEESSTMPYDVNFHQPPK